MRSTRKHRALTLLAVACCCVAGSSAPVQQRQPRFSTTAEAVILDVSVFDRAGRPVRGLTRADFTLLEDGQPQRLTTFSEINVPAAEETAVPWIREVMPDVRRNDEPPNGRVVVLVMDDASVVGTSDAGLVIDQAKRSAYRTIDTLGPLDLAAVVFTYRNSAAQEFTRDRARLRAAVDTFRPNVARRVAGRAFEPSDRDPFPWFQYHSTLATLRRVAESLAEIPERRKAVFFVSPGIPLDLAVAAPVPPTRDFASDEVAGQTRDLAWEMREMFLAARRGNVNIYSLDAYGLYANVGGEDPRLSREFLQTVSENTGGTAIVSTNEPGPAIAQAFRENGSYYLLGYQPSNQRTEGRFRTIDVKVNRPGVTVRARRGYFEATPKQLATAARPLGPASRLDNALAGILPDLGIPLQVAAAPFAVPGKRDAAVVIALGVRQVAQANTADGTEVVMTAFTPGGKVQRSVRQTARVAVRAAGDSTAHYELLSRIDLRPGRYTLRIAAHAAATNKSGSVYSDVDVPDFAREPLSMSGLVMAAIPGVASASSDALAGLMPVVPTTAREFSVRDSVTGFLRVYQGGRKPLGTVVMTASLLDGQGVRVFDASRTLGPDRFSAARAADFRQDLPLARLNPGPHLMTTEATMGEHRAKRQVIFVVLR